MKLRIISGELKGRYVVTGDGDGYRPTQERVRESTVEIIKRKIRGATVADVCAGSGAFGFEMMSRGAASVDFVETDKRRAAVIADNADRFGAGDRVRVIRDDVRKFVDGGHRKMICGADRLYDIIFYDPPYDFDDLANLVPDLITLLSESGVLIYERRRLRSEKKAPDVADKKNIVDARMYSDTVVEFYSKQGSQLKDADSIISGDV